MYTKVLSQKQFSELSNKEARRYEQLRALDLLHLVLSDSVEFKSSDEAEVTLELCQLHLLHQRPSSEEGWADEATIMLNVDIIMQRNNQVGFFVHEGQFA